MNKRVGKLFNHPIVIGDPNEVDKNEILLVRDNLTGEIQSIKKRGSNGSLEELIPDDYIYCKVKSWRTDIATEPPAQTLIDLADSGIGAIISTSYVNTMIYKGIYAPYDFVKSEPVEIDKVKGIRILKCYMIPYIEEDPVKINTLDDLQNFLDILEMKIDLSKVLEPITKAEFDSMEIPTLDI